MRPVVQLVNDIYAISYFDIFDAKVAQNQNVKAGEIIGKMRAQTKSGLALFEFRVHTNGEAIDPEPLF